MTECDLETGVTDWVIEHPETLAVLQELGVDFSCGGKSLEFACRERGINATLVLLKLRQTVEDNRTAATGRDQCTDSHDTQGEN